MICNFIHLTIYGRTVGDCDDLLTLAVSVEVVGPGLCAEHDVIVEVEELV